jgi:titin
VSQHESLAGVTLTIAPPMHDAAGDDLADGGLANDADNSVFGGSFAAVLATPVALPALSSFSAASKKIFLDFDGADAINWGTYSVPATPRFDIDGNTTNFNSTEASAITRIWARVAEKFSPFNLDVTTIDPGTYAGGEVLRVVIGGDGTWLGNAGGAAYVNGFTLPLSFGQEFNFNTVFVFTKNLSNGNVKFTAEAAAHEAGHAFGLEHQSAYTGSTRTAEYNPGDILRAPIMGSSYNATRGLWWNGPTSAGVNALQDDLSVLSRNANGFGYRTDDHGNNASTARVLTSSNSQISVAGVIETTADVDAFSFTTRSGPVSLSLAPVTDGPMLDATLTVLNASGTVVGTYNTSTLGEFAQITLTAGTYTVLVGSKGSYGDVGQYTLTGTVVEAERPPNAPTGLLVSQNGTGLALLWTDNSPDETGFRIERSVNGGATWTTLVVVAPNTTAYIDGTSPFGTTTMYRIGAENTMGVSAFTNVGSGIRVPGAINGLKAAVVSGTQVALTWTDITGETSYRVERSVNGNTWETAAIANANSTGITLAGLSGSTAYSFRVISMIGSVSGFTSVTVTATTVPAAPATVSAAGLGSTSTRITWSAVTGATGYKVQRLLDGTWTSFSSLSPSTTTFTLTSLAPGETAVLRVRAFNAVGDGDVSTTVTTGALPMAVTGVTSAALSDSSVRVSWTDLNHDSGYIVEVAPAGTTTFTLGAEVGASATSATVSGLLAGKSYTFRVRAVSPGGQGPASANTTVTTHPPVPTGLTITTLSTSSIRVSWTDVSGESGYRLERLIPSAGVETWQTVITLGTNAGSHTLTGLTAGSPYTLRLIALFNGGETAPSASVTGETTLAAPVNVGATASTSSTAVVTWSDTVGETAYLVEYRVTGGTWQSAGTTAANATSYTVTDLASATAYQFRVTAKSATQSSAASSVASATTRLAAPVGVVVAPKEQSFLEVTWNSVTAASSYIVERSLDGVLFFTAVTTSASAGNLYKDTSVSADAVYYYRVSAVGTVGRSDASEVAFASASESQPIPAPSGVSVTQLTNSSARVAWTDNSATENGFTIERTIDGGATFTKLTTTAKNATTYTDNAVPAGVFAMYRVTAAGRFVASEPVLTNSIATIPAVVTGVNVLSHTSDTVTYRWSAAAGATSYRVELSLDGTNFSSVGTTTARLFDITGLPADTAIKARIVAVAASGEAAASTAVAARTDAIPVPAVVKNLAVSDRSTTSIAMTWSAAANATSYRIEVSIEGSAFTAVETVTTASYQITDLSPGQSVAVRVIAISAGGESAPSTVVSGYTSFIAATALDAKAATATGADIVWTAGEGVVGYLLRRSADGVNFETITEVPASVTSYYDDTLTAGTTYTYQIISVGPDGTEAGSNLSATTPEASQTIRPPAAPAVTFTRADRATLSWLDFSTTETSFVVQQSLDGGVTYKTVRAVKANITSLGGVRLTRGTDVMFRVLVMSGKTVAAESRAAAVTVAPADIKSVRARAGADGVALTFAGVRGADEYIIQRADASGVFGELARTASASYTDVQTEPGTVYQYRVLAANEGGQSTPGRAASALTIPATPGITASSVDDKGRVVFTWADVNGETGFRLEQSADGASWRRVGQTRANVTSLAIAPKAHADGQTFSYRISAFNRSGTSPASAPAIYGRIGSTVSTPQTSLAAVFSQAQVSDNANLGKRLAA